MFSNANFTRNAPSSEEGGEPNDRDRGNALLRNTLRALPLLALGTLLEGCAAGGGAPSGSGSGSGSGNGNSNGGGGGGTTLGTRADPFIGGAGNRFDGSGVNNWVSYASLEGTGSTGITLDLAAPSVTVATEAGTDTLVGIVNVVGSDRDDIIRGNAADNTFEGGIGDDKLEGRAGRDYLDGGAGEDTASYESYRRGFGDTSMRGVTVTLARRNQEVAGNGDAAGDVLVRIEHLEGSIYDDTLTGNSRANTLSGGDGDDNIIGGAGDDTLRGGAGNDVLEGGDGADTLEGGEGKDTASYENSGGGVIVSLSQPAETTGPYEDYIVLEATAGGHAAGDRLRSIENLRGSQYDDELTGDGGPNILEGLGGEDKLDGKGGEDWVSYVRYVNASPGTTVTVGSVGDFNGVVVYLSTGDQTKNDGGAKGDEITEVENVRGSNYDDYLKGDGKANVLSGGRGGDTLDGGTGGGDTASYEFYVKTVSELTDSGMTGVSVNLNLDEQVEFYDFDGDSKTADTTNGEAAGDTLIDIENLLGSVYNDVLRGDGAVNVLNGEGGDDYLYGGASGDMLYGGEGNDRLYGEAGADTLNGGLGDDYLFGGVDVDVLNGGAGNDVLDGGAGVDTLNGGAGNDVFKGGGGDTFNGDAGMDIVSYKDYGTEVVVDLREEGAANPQAGTSDIFNSIEGVRGTIHDDTLIGNDKGNVLDGGKGADKLNGGSGNDTYRFHRGDGNDAQVDIITDTGGANRIEFLMDGDWSPRSSPVDVDPNTGEKYEGVDRAGHEYYHGWNHAENHGTHFYQVVFTKIDNDLGIHINRETSENSFVPVREQNIVVENFFDMSDGTTYTIYYTRKGQFETAIGSELGSEAEVLRVMAAY